MSLLRAAIALALLLAVPALVLGQDLQDILNRDRLALQKLYDDVNAAVEKSRTLQKSEPGHARHVLENALTKIQSCDVCPEDQRTLLRRRVNTRLAEVASHIRELQIAAEESVRKDVEKTRRDNPGAGRNPNDIAKNQLVSIDSQLKAHAGMRAKQAQGNLGVLASLSNSATIIEGSLEYPKYWTQLTENRKTITGQRLSDKEVALLKALNSTLSVDFNNARLREVLDYLNEKTGQAIFADDDSLKEANVDYDTPITFKQKKITLRSVLRKILGDLRLTYVLKEGGIQIVTTQKAREAMVVRSYPIDDLVGSGSPQLYGPFIAYQLRMQNVQTLINNIQNAVEPTLWEAQGGPGRITYFEPGMALIIRAPAEFHYMFGGSGMFGR